MREACFVLRVLYMGWITKKRMVQVRWTLAQRFLWIGFLNHLFYERRYIASAPSLSTTAELSKSRGLVGVLDGRVGGGAEITGARGAGDRAGRSNSERAALSACVGRRFSAPQIVWNRSTRRAGARVGTPRWLRILMITGGSSMAAMSASPARDLRQAPCDIGRSKSRPPAVGRPPA